MLLKMFELSTNMAAFSVATIESPPFRTTFEPTGALLYGASWLCDLCTPVMGMCLWGESPLLDDLDKELQRRGLRFARYADDLLILVKSERAGQRVKASLTRYLTRRLKLVVNEAKSRACPVHQSVFLGFTFRGNKLRWSEKAFADFQHRVRKLTGRSWGVSMSYRLRRLAQYLRGWMNYFGISEYYRPVPEIDHWIRRRIRMCYWKQWRWARTKVRNLLALGMSKRQAILTAISRKSYWHLSKTLATQTGMTNQWLASQGLISVRDLWIKAHGYS
jgi:RNA-directed DNA polymerase